MLGEDEQREDIHSPLVPHAAVDPNRHLAAIAQIICDAKNGSLTFSNPQTAASVLVINETNPVENSTPFQKAIRLLLTLFQYGLVGAVLASRFLTCWYRALPNMDAIKLLFSMPGLNKWEQSKGVNITALTFGSFLALTDGIQTVKTNWHGVFTLLCDPNWFTKIRDFLIQVCKKQYPIAFLLLFIFSVVPGSWSKAQAGLTDGLTHLNRIDNIKMNETQYYLFICSISFLSIISSTIFLFKKATWALRCDDALKNKPEWNEFLKDNQSWLRKVKIIGISQAIISAFANCVSLFYANQKFQFETTRLILFLLIGIIGAFCNYLYTYHPVYLFESILNRDDQEKQKSMVSLNTQSAEKTSCCESVLGSVKNINAFFSVSGAAILQSVSFIRSLQVILLAASAASGKEDIKTASESGYFLIPVALISVFFGWGAFAQNMAMWGNHTVKKPTYHTGNEVPVVVVPQDGLRL